MSGLILHCGSEATTLEQVMAVPVPQATDSWNPVAYGDAIQFLKDTARERLGLTVKSESFGLNKSGHQMFGRITLDTGDAEKGLSIGMRQSYDKSLALGLVGGANVFVCDNLCFSGEVSVVRKHTSRIMEQIESRPSTEDGVNSDDVYLKTADISVSRGKSLKSM